MSIGSAVILGLVQGLAEFLPISSSGHLAILQNLFNITDLENGHLFFDVLLHLGTLTAICFFYWGDIVKMFREAAAVMSGQSRIPDENGKRRRYPSARLLMLIIAATVPLVIILPVSDYIELLSENTLFVGIALILTGFILFSADRMAQGEKTEKNMSFKDALIIGLCQCVAVLPGISRSGTTITAAIACGEKRSFAVKFSLLMSIPAVLGATVLELIKAIKAGIDVSLIPAYLVGMAAAMISGIFAIMLIRYIVTRGKFGGFAYYCWLVGALTIVLTMIF